MNEQRSSELYRERTLHLFAGAGGGILADILLGRQPVCAVEINPYCQQVLAARQEDGAFPWFPVFADVTKFDGRPWRGLVDRLAGGFPCQDVSIVGSGEGLDGEKSGLWGEMRRIIGEVRPAVVDIENSPMLTVRGLARVLADLAALGYDAKWGCFPASATGAPHGRDRFWLVANAVRQHEQGIVKGSADPQERQEPRARPARPLHHGYREWPSESGIRRVDDGVAHRAHRLKALGNGQVPRVVVAAHEALT